MQRKKGGKSGVWARAGAGEKANKKVRKKRVPAQQKIPSKKKKGCNGKGEREQNWRREGTGSGSFQSKREKERGIKRKGGGGEGGKESEESPNQGGENR